MIDGTIEISITVRRAENVHNAFVIYDLDTLSQMLIGQKVVGLIAMEKAFDVVKASGIDVSAWTRDEKQLCKKLL